MDKIRVAELAWYNAGFRELELLPNWRVSVSRMAGHDRGVLSVDEIAAIVSRPDGSRPLHELAGPQSRVGIIFDDMSRVTQIADIVPAVLQELARAGVPDDGIRFIGATGCHQSMNREDFVKKLGEGVLRRFRVYSHNPFTACVSAGTTSQGIEIFVNAEVMSCDLKIAVGSVVPHKALGFSGGPKTVLPGICSFETVKAFHRYELDAQRFNSNIFDHVSDAGYPALDVCKEAAALIGLDLKLDAIINSLGETVALYVGSPESVYVLARKDAAHNYLTSLIADADIVIANTYAKTNEFESGLSMAFLSVAAGGDIVLIANAPDGHIPHYLFGSWGSMPRYQFTHITIPERVHRLYIFTEYPEMTMADYFQNHEKVRILSRWEDVLDNLEPYHRQDAVVAVYPNADIQYAVTASQTRDHSPPTIFSSLEP